MSEEEVIKEFKNLIYNSDFEYIELMDEDGFTGWHELFENILDLYNKEKEKNKELEEQLRKVNEYIRNEMYIDDNPTICGDEEDTITELPISLNLYDEDLRELLKLLEERN